MRKIKSMMLITFVLCGVLAHITAKAAMEPLNAVSVVSNYAMWSYMFGCEIDDEPHTRHTEDRYFMDYDLISVSYNSETFLIDSSRFEMMAMEKESTDERMIKLLAFLATHEYGAVPEKRELFEVAKKKVFEILELAMSNLEDNLTWIYYGGTSEFYRGEEYRYEMFMDSESKNVYISANHIK